MLLVTIVASQTRGTMEQQCRGNSYSVQRDLFIYTSARSHRPRTLTKAQATDRWTILIKIVRELACDLFKCRCIGSVCIANIRPRDKTKRGYVVAGYNGHRVKRRLSTVCIPKSVTFNDLIAIMSD